MALPVERIPLVRENINRIPSTMAELIPMIDYATRSLNDPPGQPNDGQAHIDIQRDITYQHYVMLHARLASLLTDLR